MGENMGRRMVAKVEAFCWLVLKRCILTWDNLQTRGINGPLRCCMCKGNNESINHLLDECPVVDSIWEKGATIFKKNHQHKGRLDITLEKCPIKVFKNKIVNRLWELLPGFTVWELWKTCNSRIFENKPGKQGKCGPS